MRPTVAIYPFAIILSLAGCGNGAVEHRERGVSFLPKGEYDAAIAEFNEAVRLDPNDAEAYRLRGDAWGFKRDNDKAIADYDESIRLDPNDPRAPSARAILVEAKLKSAAIAPLDDAVRRKPKDPSVYLARAEHFSDIGQLDKAIADYNEAIRLDGKDVGALKGAVSPGSARRTTTRRWPITTRQSGSNQMMRARTRFAP